jgi:DNA uptake protein ComE-like DNA-binding protein
MDPYVFIFTKKMKEWLVSYLTFSKKERTGILVLLGLILVIWLLPEYYRKSRPGDNMIANVPDSLLDAPKQSVIIKKGTTSPRLFNFDPNTITNEQWEELGLKKRTILTIRNYLSKGGRFRQPEDLGKIYGFRREDAERLIPFVHIEPHKNEAQYLLPSRNFAATDKQTFTRKVYQRKMVTVDVNSADSAAFESLPAIGTKLAVRIIRFREALGGFYSIEQLREVYGINDTIFNLIARSLTMHTGVFRKMRINDWSIDSLDMHPYIQKHEARAIVKYRNQHGRFNDADDLGKISFFSSDQIGRLKPYIDLE